MWWLGGVGRFGLGRVNSVGNLSINGVVASSCLSHFMYKCNTMYTSFYAAAQRSSSLVAGYLT